MITRPARAEQIECIRSDRQADRSRRYNQLTLAPSVMNSSKQHAAAVNRDLHPIVVDVRCASFVVDGGEGSSWTGSGARVADAYPTDQRMRVLFSAVRRENDTRDCAEFVQPPALCVCVCAKPTRYE